MERRRSGALRDADGVYHVASRLAFEGFHATVARDSGAGADVLAGLAGSTATAALAVRTAVCPPGFGEGAEGEVCGWRVGEGTAAADGPFLAPVDPKRGKELPRDGGKEEREV